jgi:hypothetical protein
MTQANFPCSELWRLWYEDQLKARKALERLHAQDGGSFVIAPH